jgi:3-oxoacyl-[acyl-carrier protein] reductase
MELGLKDKTAVVTASSRGLGRAAAVALAQEGARLAICSRSAAAIDKTGREILERYNTEVLALPCDVTDEQAVGRFAEKVLETGCCTC